VTELPESALIAAEKAIIDAAADFGHDDLVAGSFREFARAALEAAAPVLAGVLLRPLLKRHPRIEGQWGPSCGTCWIRGGSRAAWPCAEVLAISVLLPLSDEEHDTLEVPDAG
jgi:hypothetical protein